MMQRREITIDDKMRYLREVENIHRMSKKVLPPRGTTWAQIADRQLQLALGHPVKRDEQSINMRRGHMHHMHSPRSARVIERTLKNGSVHPDVLHSYRGDNSDSMHKNSQRRFVRKLGPTIDTPAAMHIVENNQDLIYPTGHLQGYGFVPGDHQVVSHVKLESAAPDVKTVSTENAGHYQ